MQALLYGERARAGGGVPVIRGAVLEEAAAGADRLVNRSGDHRRADWLVTRAEALGDEDDVGRHAFRLEGPSRAAAAHAAHHLVQDEQDAVTIADLAHAAEIARQRRHGAERRAGERFCDEGYHGLRPEELYLLPQFGRLL